MHTLEIKIKSCGQKMCFVAFLDELVCDSKGVNMQKNISTKLSENVVIADLEFLNSCITQSIQHLQNITGGELKPIDIAELATCVALDGGVPVGNEEVQFIFVCNGKNKSINNCGAVKSVDEIDGKAVRTAVGEIAFYAVNSEELVSSEELFCDLLELALDSADVKNLISVADMSKYSEAVDKILSQESKKNVTVLAMQQVEERKFYKVDFIGYALMKSLGVRL